MARHRTDIQATKADEKIIRKIYLVREHKVMLDFDLADLCEVETKELNQALKQNIDRFPEDFMFRLSTKEWITMRSRFVTASRQIVDVEDTENMWSQISIASQKKRNVSVQH